MKQNISNQKNYLRTRLILFRALGGKCARCGERDFRVLEIHHSHGDGGKKRKEAGGGSNAGRKDKSFTEEFGRAVQGRELLCSNCHTKESNTDTVLLSTLQVSKLLNMRRDELYELVEGGGIERTGSGWKRLQPISVFATVDFRLRSRREWEWGGYNVT